MATNSTCYCFPYTTLIDAGHRSGYDRKTSGACALPLCARHSSCVPGKHPLRSYTNRGKPHCRENPIVLGHCGLGHLHLTWPLKMQHWYISQGIKGRADGTKAELQNHQETKYTETNLIINTSLSHHLFTMQLSMTQMVSSTIYLLSLCAALVRTKDCRCGLPGVRVPFKSCSQRQAEWRPHDHDDIRLVGDCLPTVSPK